MQYYWFPGISSRYFPDNSVAGFDMDNNDRNRLVRLQQARKITSRIWEIEMSRLAGLQAQLQAIRQKEGKAFDLLGADNAADTLIVARLRDLYLKRNRLVHEIEQQKLSAQQSAFRAKSFDRFYEKMLRRGR